MADIVDLSEVKAKERARKNTQARALIVMKFQNHADLGLLLNLLSEYGSETVLKVVRDTYDIDIALA
tara:strand:+ start:30250 stop:30450 length:201 start_codon:yes stop_codon:yes gene_type:complete